jgi:cyanophycinase
MEVRRGREGRLVIIGGALQSENTPVYRAVLEARWGEGPLCVLPTASGTPASSMEGYVDAFDALAGAGTAQGIYLTVDNRSEASDREMADRLRECSGFFFTGGVQSRILDVFLPEGESTPAYHALWERYQAGAVISGSSAGAAIMSDPMIAGGSSGGALREGIRSSGEGDGVWLTQGLGFLRLGLVDQHFLARGRWARLMVGVLGAPNDRLGFGIDENTALVVEGDSAWVVGESGVVFFDARSAAREDGGNGGYGIRTFLLGNGDGVDLRTGAVGWADGKAPIPEGTEPFASPDADLFSSWSLLRILFELASSPDRRLTFPQEGHFLEFRKEPGFRAVGWDGLGVQDTPAGLFLGPFVLSVWRE